MDGEKKENPKEDPNEFGKVIDALHNKSKLSSLRTYQGDMAEFIHDKNESVVSIAVKEKVRKEEIQKQEIKREEAPKRVENKSEGLPIKLNILLASLVLILGGVALAYFVIERVNTKPLEQVAIPKEVIPYNNIVTLSNISDASALNLELDKLLPSNGVSIIKISDGGGVALNKSSNLFNFLEVSLPATLTRSLRDEYALGVASTNKQNSAFIVITVSDFGRAFSGMLDWEENITEDLAFLNISKEITLATTTPPLLQDFFSWRDIIIKNKDIRALTNNKEEAKIAYTFLDKNTILVVSDLSLIGEISSQYASRSVAR